MTFPQLKGPNTALIIHDQMRLMISHESVVVHHLIKKVDTPLLFRVLGNIATG